MDMTTGRPNHIMDYLTKLHQGGWWGWRKTDDDGNEIPNSDRMQYQHLIVHPKLWNNELKIMEDNPHSKPTEQECTDGLVALQTAFDDAKTKQETDKTSGNNKLKALGLTDDEIIAVTKG